MNITTKYTHLISLRIFKLVQDNVEEDMNGIGDEISLYFAKKGLLYYDESGQ